ncbi:hypothetical protein PR202_gb20977 [Eleusine coracana subsp. coracana]|uniref:RRM domain-containing protein n=1 Tax=Eleusine coracana subsp. coracana TaxID=191504 RepID=A0AAV5FC53_ELECO|nr:hypothetical protein PR202_gb20977 [Eleusine coracana subsp. coracana]
MNGQNGPSPPQQASSGAPPPPQQQQAPPPPYYQQQYYQQGPPPPMWGHQPQYAPPQQYAAPPQQYGPPPPQQYAPHLSSTLLRLSSTPHRHTKHTLMTFNGHMMPNIHQAYKLNWASSSAGDKRSNDGPDHTIFVGDLAADVTDYMLEETFRASYPSVRGAKVVTDRATGHSKGYGFVRFGDMIEQTRAMTEMNGMMLSTRQMRIGAANKKDMGAQQTYATNGMHDFECRTNVICSFTVLSG